MKLKIWLAIPFILPAVAFADQYHYNNIVIGDRAIGLGGAFTGVSDDASGVYYNPAGLGFALSNDISGSANAIYRRTITYKKTIGDNDFVERASGSLPSFFGGLQKLDHLVEGLVFAFGLYTTDSTQKDQNDLFNDLNIVLLNRETCEGSATARALTLQRFHRTVNMTASTSHVAAALGYRIGNNVSIGLGVDYLTVDELLQEYQDSRVDDSRCGTADDQGISEPYDVVALSTQNIRQHLLGAAIVPVVGLQASFLGRLSLGITARLGSYMSQSIEQDRENRAINVDPEEWTNTIIPGGGVARGITKIAFIGASETSIAAGDFPTPLGTLPMEFRGGIGYFASTRLMLAADVSHTMAVTDSVWYPKEAVTNYAAGMEFFLFPSLPIRLGWFTNNDARPEVVEGKLFQADHLDFQGYSLFAAWVQPNSQIGAGVVYQLGTGGKAQKVDGRPDIQKVEGQSFTFAFSATHSF